MKRIIMVLDGSGVNAAYGRYGDLSNVFRLNLMIDSMDDSGITQVVFYSPGVGTQGNDFDAILGKGIDRIIREAYVNLANNYADGDQIYLFGYSRGGVAARALAGMISIVGLLEAHHLDHLDKAWRYFLLDPNEETQERRNLEGFIEGFVVEKPPVIEFLGTFDPVEGKPFEDTNLFAEIRFRNLRMDKCVRRGVQILSIDDTRNPSFSPLLWDGPSEGYSLVECIDKNNHDQKLQVMEQIWVPGVHGDVGGNTKGNFLSDVALLIMLDRIKVHCKELTLDHESEEYVLDIMRSYKSVEISDERFDIFRRLLNSQPRRIGGSCNEYSSILYNLMFGHAVDLRGKTRSYTPGHVQTKLPEKSTRYDKDFEKAFYEALNKMTSHAN
jgi:uncharacterized protein (DUF2235 family)